MPGTATPEARPSQQPAKQEAKEAAKFPKASDQLVAQLALGNFKKDAQPADIQRDVSSKKPTEVHQDTYNALKARHDDQRKADVELYKQTIRRTGKDPDQLEPKALRHLHMEAWAGKEGFSLLVDMLKIKRVGQDELKPFTDVLAKLDIKVDINKIAAIDVQGNIDPESMEYATEIATSLYDNNSHTEGAFYKNYCTGDTNKAFLEKLNVDEMILVEGFLTRVLGSKTAFDALVATKQAQERLKDTSTPLSPTTKKLGPGEDKILDFLAGAGTPIKKDDQTKAQQQQPEHQPSGDPDKDISISAGQLATDPSRTSTPIKPPEKKSGPQTQYIESLLAEKATKDRPAPPMLILANQLDRAAAHFRQQGTNNNEDLAFALAKNFTGVGVYQRIVEQHAFGPQEFERAKDEASNVAAAERNKDRAWKLTQDAQKHGERVIATDAWLHYFSPHTPDQRPETQYRIYLNPDTAKFPDVLASLLKYAEKNDLYFKTADPRDPGLFTRLDTIVVYLNDQNADKVTHFIQDELFVQHQNAFQGRAAPGSSTVTIRPGIGLASQPARGINGAELTAGQKNADKIREALSTFSLDEIKRTTGRYPTEADFVKSPEYRLMKNALETGIYVILPDAIKHSPATREMFVESLLHTTYNNAKTLTVTPDSSNYPVIRLPRTEVLNTFKQKLRAQGLGSFADGIDALSPGQLDYQYGSPCSLNNAQITRAAMGINLYARLQHGQNPGSLFLGQYETYRNAEGKKPELTQPNLALRSIEKYPGGNEDHAFMHEGLQIGGMFDGMGGYANGEEASALAMQIIGQRLSSLPDNASLTDVQSIMRQAMEEANNQVAGKYPGSGTTGSVFKIWTGSTGERKIVVANVGDSRTWVKKKDGTLLQLTTDDNQVKSLLRAGRITLNDYYQIQKALDRLTSQTELNQAITLEDGSKHTLQEYWDQSGITRSIGQKPFKMDPIQTFDIEAGDMVFYTSDGVHDNLSTNEILQIIKDAKTPQELTGALTQTAYGISQLSKFEDYRAKEDDITAGAMIVS